VLEEAEAVAVAAQFGVAYDQVRRDHFLSHLLAALAAMPDVTERVVFFGGTALARTHLLNGRLSEDVDLLACTDRRDLAVDIERSIDRRLRRKFGALRWNPSLATVRGNDQAVVYADDGLSIRVQLLSARDYPEWPTEVRDIEQRYSDAAPARLRVLTRAAFVAAKTAAWGERAAPRDLYDLWALATSGAVDDEALQDYVVHGPTSRPPGEWMFKRPPSEDRWHIELAAQTTLDVTARVALDVVRQAWAAAGS
jgi:predicted nucleotidyltransferase component of viral defense system